MLFVVIFEFVDDENLRFCLILSFLRYAFLLLCVLRKLAVVVVIGVASFVAVEFVEIPLVIFIVDDVSTQFSCVSPLPLL